MDRARSCRLYCIRQRNETVAAARQIRGGQEWKQGDKWLLRQSKGERIVAWARTAIKGWWIKVKVLVLPKRMEMEGEGQEDVLQIQSVSG